MIRLLLAAAALTLCFVGTMAYLRADEPDPLALPCTVDTTACVKHVPYKCESCGSETCWIIQTGSC